MFHRVLRLVGTKAGPRAAGSGHGRGLPGRLRSREPGRPELGHMPQSLKGVLKFAQG